MNSRFMRGKTLFGRPLLDPVTNLSSRVLMNEERVAPTHGLHYVYPSDNFDQASSSAT